jgi:hypothetical protein
MRGAWSGQNEWNAELNRVKKEIRRVYAMDWTSPHGNKSLLEWKWESFYIFPPFSEEGPNNWAYALFLLRALLEFFKDIFDKLAGKEKVIAYFCTSTGVYAGLRGQDCLVKPTVENSENIEFIDEWFTRNSSVWEGKTGELLKLNSMKFLTN